VCPNGIGLAERLIEAEKALPARERLRFTDTVVQLHTLVQPPLSGSTPLSTQSRLSFLRQFTYVNVYFMVLNHCIR
jgi:hypothetical protein